MTPMRVPLFPLPNLVLFPGVLLPLYVFEPRYRALLADVQASGGPFGIVRILESAQESSKPFHERVSLVGTLAHLQQAQGHEDGTSTILVGGGERFEVQSFYFGTPYLSAEVKPWPLPADGAEDGLARELLSALLRLNPDRADALGQNAPDDPLLLSSYAAANLPLSATQREAALRAPTLRARLDLLLAQMPQQTKLLN
ncbi:LON peptidase substrate-binding domain-containing protein [Deinococcus sp. HMF7604]|uniref:LON peptidase substrate-binding domain-containing protein n=1 Tax=Deinococcus betulae TaxID=2873312 RepID=UPI001CD034D1|nr:LON peptidase substrate-binding domain-containing protein [Deinococcus betulae]MBZ9749307.1 LON peptidase substrate-binding domain-containing protein [Deinococcus betulae]